MSDEVEEPPETIVPLDNEAIAQRLEEVAGLLEAQGANVFRVRAYRLAAKTVRELDVPVHQILEASGVEGLTRLPGIGESLGARSSGSQRPAAWGCSCGCAATRDPSGSLRPCLVSAWKLPVASTSSLKSILFRSWRPQPTTAG